MLVTCIGVTNMFFDVILTKHLLSVNVNNCNYCLNKPIV